MPRRCSQPASPSACHSAASQKVTCTEDRSSWPQACAQACGSLDLSSVHVTFCEAAEWEGLGEAGWLQRLGMQFHWDNPGYATFEDFLAALSSRKRKVIRRERRDARGPGFTLEDAARA